MTACLKPAAGYRRHDAAFLAAEKLARQFEGLNDELTPGRLLAAFKRAAPAMQIPMTVVHMIDQLFARTRQLDWAPGSEPIVWPRNETLADTLGVSVRQVQNLLKRAVGLGLLAMKDSPNGHRGGRRAPNGDIMWAYGIDLRPLGTRYPQFLQIAAVAEAEGRQRDDLRRRLTIARKGIAQIAQTSMEAGLVVRDWASDIELARMATAHARETRAIERLEPIVVELEALREAMLIAFDVAMNTQTDQKNGQGMTTFSVENSPMDAADCTHSTTTEKLSSPEGQRYNARREAAHEKALGPFESRDTSVTKDLERHEISAAFIAKVCAETCGTITHGVPRWADIFDIARREAEGLSIPRQVWHEAIRVMGTNGAAAAMIAIAHKADTGLIEKPGAYLRGMTARAARGELLLGRTFHGFRDAQAKRQSAPATVQQALAARASPRAFRNAQEVIRMTALAWKTAATGR
jgi:replication initiation protein RepC